MEIVLHSLGMPFNGETISKQSLGGSESAAYYQARELAKRGHTVSVFTASQEEGIFDGVSYCWAGPCTEQHPLGERFEFYARNTPHDVLIIQRHPLAFHGQFASKVNIWQLHDLALYRTQAMANAQMWNVDAVTVVSEWHKQQVCEVYGFDPDFVFVVPNGVDEALYNKPNIEPFRIGPDKWLGKSLIAMHEDNGPEDPWWARRTDKFYMLYQSRPERGLEHLVRPGGIMDRLRDTNAHLLYCAYSNTLPSTAAYYAQLDAWAAELPNVTNLGALTKAQLAALQKSCDLLCYSTEFGEVSCITAMEAMHANLPMLTSAVAALPETCEGSGTMLVPLKDGKADEDRYVEIIRELMANPSQIAAMRGFQAHAAGDRTWAVAVDRLELAIGDAFERHRGTPAAAMRYRIEHSDISMPMPHPDWEEASNPIGMRTIREINELYAFTESPEAYAAHYAKHQTVYYNDFEDRVIGEDVTGTTRFRGVHTLISSALERNPTARVLDYGCAHGHYTIPLAKMFPKARFTGMDVSSRAVGAALKWAQRDGVTNVEFRIGDQSVLEDVKTMCPLVYDETSTQLDATTGQPIGKASHRDLFDVILAGEVVEHVPDWEALLDAFRDLLKPNGLLVITTPVGRWEWTGTEAFREAREHLHHFEKQDIRDICGRNPHHVMYAPAGNDRTGRVLGSWVWGVQPIQPFGVIDYERKRKMLAPRETLSACLIVKDADKTLRKCVESFIDWVDEVVIAIDPASKDRTREVIAQLEQDFRWKPFIVFDGVKAIEEGFDAARNLTVEKASGDWVMWCDADEEVRYPWNIWKYLRPSQYQAFGFPQVHYSADPDQVLTTDFPCRLFRNGKGIKFYGLVHEHPEIAPGKAIPRSTIRHDVKFLHNGYVDEETRRARFARNLPLLHRDVQKYPERGLNRFLMLRDIAQSLMFEQEQTGGRVLEHHADRAQHGIDLWSQIVDKDPIRMAMDSLQYYSHCVETLGRGFVTEVTYKAANPQAPDLECRMNFKGKFASREHYAKLMRKLEDESLKHFESPYL